MTDLPFRARRPADGDAWPLEELVHAQRLACEGKGFDEIARALGRTVQDVRQRLDPDPVGERPEFARVGYPHLKRR
jgi:predicted transcriptional regulator